MTSEPQPAIEALEEGDKLRFKGEGKATEIVKTFVEDGETQVKVRDYAYARGSHMLPPIEVHTVTLDDIRERAQGQTVEVLDT